MDPEQPPRTLHLPKDHPNRSQLEEDVAARLCVTGEADQQADCRETVKGYFASHEELDPRELGKAILDRRTAPQAPAAPTPPKLEAPRPPTPPTAPTPPQAPRAPQAPTPPRLATPPPPAPP
ncbi:MAG: hypothetical protein Q8S13_01505, partial [Dehalococcoidia bacterium]|nr:hypothetical protein [Dehalococcoidia bacterium]